MPDMNSDQIRDLSVRVVEGFFNNKVPLSVGLAKEASANDLNLEQIKRACEVTNTITHLKLMQMTEDRTQEFPLCKTAEVMSSLVTPETGVEKVAQKDSEPSLIKSASFDEAVSTHVYSTHEQNLFLLKEASLNEKALELLTDRSIVVQSQLMKLASEISKDNAWLDKMSCANVDNFAELSVLVSGTKSVPRDFGGFSMFKEAELKQVKQVSELFKEAKQIVAEKAKRSQLCKRAEDLSSGLVKEAFFGAVAKGIGSAIGTVAGALPGSMFKAVAAPIKGAAKNVTNLAAETGIGKAVHVPHVTPTKAQSMSAKAIGASAGTGLAVGTDSYFYQTSGGAGFNSNGTSKNVWDALQH